LLVTFATFDSKKNYSKQESLSISFFDFTEKDTSTIAHSLSASIAPCTLPLAS